MEAMTDPMKETTVTRKIMILLGPLAKMARVPMTAIQVAAMEIPITTTPVMVVSTPTMATRTRQEARTATRTRRDSRAATASSLYQQVPQWKMQ